MFRKAASQQEESLPRKIAFFVVLLLCFFSIGDILDKSIDAQDLYTNATSDASLQIDFAGIPLSFIQNKGQVDEQAQFYAKASRYTLWLIGNGKLNSSGFPTNTARIG